MVVVEREPRDGVNVLAWVVALILVALLVFGAIWVWNSGVLRGGDETNINIETPEDGGGGGSAPATVAP